MDPTDRWAQVQARTPDADGRFVYAVRTTGIYCRPCCPSRQPKRENVDFFDTPAQAQAAGYRACKRCRPDDSRSDQRRRDAVAAACRAMEQSISNISLAELAAQAGMSPHHFHRIFSQVAGLTPKAYAQAVRAKRVQATLAQARTVTEALLDAGFNSSTPFYDAQRQLGVKPADVRAGGAGLHLRYALAGCRLGRVLVAAADLGICAIEFDDTDESLVASLRARFPRACFEPADAQFQSWVQQVLGYIEQPEGVLDLPLDVQGTIFQRKVWDALRAIPSGQTVSYTEVAQRIGQPGAARAVARACASNQVAVLIPCHRVVRSDGQLSGYRWGVERKAELLKREKKA